MGNPRINALSLCSGVGMLDIAVDLACDFHGTEVRTVAYAEREASAAATLLARMEEQSLEPAPIWIDSLECLPREPLRGRVDAVVAGFPCPDFSVAGKQAGCDGERYLLPAILEIARDVGARWLFLENVPGIFSAGNGAAFGEIQRTLAAFGWSAEWLTLRASDVGASHRRERWFCVAYCDGAGCDEPQRDGDAGGCSGFADGGEAAGNAPSHDKRRHPEPAMHGQRQPTGGSSGDVADPMQLQQRQRARWERVQQAGKELADTGGSGCKGSEWRSAHDEPGSSARGSVSECGNPPLYAPGPDSPEWAGILERWPYLAPAIEPGVCVVVDGLAVVVDEARADQLRAAGNGVVALQAACAFAELIGRFRT